MECQAPFFIVGAPRSGTTLLAVLLNNHSEIYVGKTTPAHALLAVYQRLLDSYGLESDVRQRTAPERLRLALRSQELAQDLCQHVTEHADEGLRSLLTHARADTAGRQGKRIWGDKSPFMLNQMPVMSHVMPGVRFIHVIRDGRAVAQSRHSRRGYHPWLAIHEWKRMVWQGRIDGEIVGPERYLEVQFERLLTEPETEVAQVCAFLGVEFEAEMLDLQVTAPAGQAESYVSKTLDRSKIDTWQAKYTPRQIAALEAIAGDLLQACGYPLLHYSPEGPFRALSPLAVTWYYQQLSFRDLLRPRRAAMINQQVVEVSVPLAGRLRRFLSESAAQYLNERVIEFFRRRRVMLD